MSLLGISRPLACCWKSFRQALPIATRHYNSLALVTGPRIFHSPNSDKPRRRIKIHNPIAAPKSKDPIADFTAIQLKTLDPDGVRQNLFSRANKDAIRPGDIIQVRRHQDEPFAGVLMNIRRRGIDTAFLLRNQLARTGVEMWFKLYSPTISGIDLVQRSVRRVRRAKLYYLRLPKHDRGSVQNIVSQYTRQRALLRGEMKEKYGKQRK